MQHRFSRFVCTVYQNLQAMLYITMRALRWTVEQALGKADIKKWNAAAVTTIHNTWKVDLPTDWFKIPAGVLQRSVRSLFMIMVIWQIWFKCVLAIILIYWLTWFAFRGSISVYHSPEYFLVWILQTACWLFPSVYFYAIAAMVDILDIKWDSLIQQDKQKSSGVQRSSALRRYTAHHIFSRIGVSTAFAGEALVQKLKTICQQQMNDEAAELASNEEAYSG